MRRTNLLAVFGLVFTLIITTSCGKDDDDDDAADSCATAFEEDDPSGKIGGTKWTFGSGRVEVPASADDKWGNGFRLLQDNVENICDEFVLSSSDNRKVMWYFKELEEADVALSFDMNDSESNHTVTLFDNSEGDNMNRIATCGKVSITKISKTTVDGQIYVYFDDDNTINGTFSLSKCCEKTVGLGHELCTE